ncbi:MAG: chemotaxis protein CheW [Spirochaetota bacterium]
MTALDENQFLTFGIDGDVYAIPVSKVQEVLEYIKPVRLPKTAPYLKGLINIRGTGIPVVDLRMRFDMPELGVTSDTAIVVVEIYQGSSDMLIIGALTDEVHEVIQIDPDQQEPAPRFGSRIDANFIKSIGKKDGTFIIILDVDKIFSQAETAAIAEVPAMAESH